MRLTRDEVWEAVIIAVAAMLFILLFKGSAHAAEVEWLALDASHISDLTRGKAPWARDVPEPYHDSIMTGITITAGKRRAVEIDVVHGRKRLAGTAGDGHWQSGTTARLRYYPLRSR